MFFHYCVHLRVCCLVVFVRGGGGLIYFEKNKTLIM